MHRPVPHKSTVGFQPGNCSGVPFKVPGRGVFPRKKIVSAPHPPLLPPAVRKLEASAVFTMPVKVRKFTTMELYFPAVYKVELRSLKVAVNEEHEATAKSIKKLCVTEVTASKSQVVKFS